MFLKKIFPERFSNKLLYLLSQRSVFFKCSLIVFLSCLIFIIWLFLFIRPLNAALKFNKAKLKQLHNLKQICCQSYDDCFDLSKKIEHLNAKLDRKINIIGGSSAHQSLNKVIECITRNGVTLIDYGPIKAEKFRNNLKENLHDDEMGHVIKSDDIESLANKKGNSDFGRKVSFELILEGTFINIFNFFRCLSAAKYCLKCDQIYLNKNEQGLIGCKLMLDILQLSN